MATVIWRDVVWAHAGKRVFARLGPEYVCHAGLYFRDAKDGDREVSICGVGGVMTLPRARKQGCASAAMASAAQIMKDEGCDFGLLFCETHNVALYEALGWHVFKGDVWCDQPLGRVRFDMMHTMVLPIASAPQSRLIDLCGLPW
ncbi:MAG TPA: GNAT family N-acetyltransferase [Rhizomicrobium sp.]|nr:GNAT family N-acetyltransferase [Rhizomicrobium sp.]